MKSWKVTSVGSAWFHSASQTSAQQVASNNCLLPQKWNETDPNSTSSWNPSACEIFQRLLFFLWACCRSVRDGHLQTERIRLRCALSCLLVGPKEFQTQLWKLFTSFLQQRKQVSYMYASVCSLVHVECENVEMLHTSTERRTSKTLENIKTLHASSCNCYTCLVDLCYAHNKTYWEWRSPGQALADLDPWFYFAAIRHKQIPRTKQSAQVMQGWKAVITMQNKLWSIYKCYFCDVLMSM